MTGTATASRTPRRAVSVRNLVNRIQVGLQEEFPRSFWVEAELTGFKIGPRGHAFGALKEEGAQVEAVIWSRDVQALKFKPEDGMQVLARVRKVDFYAPHGRLRVHVDRLEVQGTGALMRALEERKKRLTAEGLFDEARKRPLPFLPVCIGIATARTGAVIRDMLRILGDRYPDRHVILRPCRVQGDGAAPDIAAAIDDLNRHGGAEVIIVGRGGGSVEDLWAFNEEEVVRAIARSRVPVVSAVGHETDWSLADLVADLRAPTPTAAAQEVVPERDALELRLVESEERVRAALGRRLELAHARLARLEPALADPRRLVRERRLALDSLGRRARSALVELTPNRRTRLERAARSIARSLPEPAVLRERLLRHGDGLRSAMTARVERERRAVGAFASQVNALSPLSVLDRGFSLARDSEGRIVRDADSVEVGETLTVRFARGSAVTRVEELRPEPTSGVGSSREEDDHE